MSVSLLLFEYHPYIVCPAIAMTIFSYSLKSEAAILPHNEEICVNSVSFNNKNDKVFKSVTSKIFEQNT